MAKLDYSYEHHLIVKEIFLEPGQEWALRLPGWSMILIKEGTGYWMNRQQNQQLLLGAILLVTDRVEGSILASRLGGVLLHIFRVEPHRLTGLITLREQRYFEASAVRAELSLRILPPESSVAARLRDLSCHPKRNALHFRIQFLQLLFEAFGSELKEEAPEPARHPGAKDRLRKLLEQTPVSEMLEMSFSDLVEKAMCTPRHLNRVFHEVVGKSFRDKQTEVRLSRAQELLATTESKVLEVALESGYQSVSLFNLMFKKHFGVTPGLWREKIRGQRTVKRKYDRSLFLKV
jgi:AraC-like DNA-binding protein